MIFVQLLQQQVFLTQTQMPVPISSEAVRQKFDTVEAAVRERRAQDLRRRGRGYLLVTRQGNLTQQGIQQGTNHCWRFRDQKLALRFIEAGDRVRQVQLQRNDINPAEATILGDQLKQCVKVLVESQNLADPKAKNIKPSTL